MPWGVDRIDADELWDRNHDMVVDDGANTGERSVNPLILLANYAAIGLIASKADILVLADGTPTGEGVIPRNINLSKAITNYIKTWGIELRIQRSRGSFFSSISVSTTRPRGSIVRLRYPAVQRMGE